MSATVDVGRRLASTDANAPQESVRTAKAARETIRRLHEPPRSALGKFFCETLVFFSLAACAILAWNAGWWPLSVACWLLAGHFGHLKPLAFHDASHGTLHRNKWLNEALGVFLGTVIFVPLTVYRHAHTLHHAYLNSERDPELWPFVIPGTPRWLRWLAVAVEIPFGMVYTPLLFLRSVFCYGKLPRNRARRIALEYALIVAFWTPILLVVHHFGWWEYFAVGYVGPAAVAGMYQTLRKYTEHLGLMGDSILSNSRTIQARGPISRWISYTMQHVDQHGTHHRYAHIPHQNMSQATEFVYSDPEVRKYVFPSYLSAFLAMVRTLGDPKAGPQWLRQEAD